MFISCVVLQLQGSFCHLGGHGEVHQPTKVIYAATVSAPEAPPSDNIGWLKGVAAAALFVEALLGALIPLLWRIRAMDSAFQQGLLSMLNCFAGGVFITFGAALWPARVGLICTC
jgi:hypothetical protein